MRIQRLRSIANYLMKNERIKFYYLPVPYISFQQFQPNSQSPEPPSFNLPGDTSTIKHEDSALPSIQHDQKLSKSLNEEEEGDHGGGHEVERYPITTVDFSRVETPFIIGIWILFASIAKIGECHLIVNEQTVPKRCHQIRYIGKNMTKLLNKHNRITICILFDSLV